ncbi:uncharacterized protein LOC100176502 [Ciona intestinalis]
MSSLSDGGSNNIRPPSRMRRDKSRSSSKLKWNNVPTNDNGPIQTPSLKVEDYEPGYALRRIALLYESNKNEDVASLIKDLSKSSLSKIYPDFPIDLFIEGIPHTLCIINALYSRVFMERPQKFPLDKLPFGTLVMQIVKLYARSLTTDLPKVPNWDSQESQCKNLLKIAGFIDGVGILKMLRHRRRCLERALEGLGEHGAVSVETSPIGEEEVKSEVMSLPSALRTELDRMILNCKFSSQKLNRTNRALSERDQDTSPTSRKSLFSPDPIKSDKLNSSFELPSECNHQRLMKYTSTDIQERLYKNKAILNIIEPTMNYAQLPRLVSIMQDRIERDKDLLLTFSQLRKEIISVPIDAKLAPALNHYSQAFNAVINALKEFVPDDPGTPETFSTSGFRSDSESNISPNKSKTSSKGSPSHNGSAGDLETKSTSNLSPNGPEAGNRSLKQPQIFEAVALHRKECDRLRHELHKAQKAIAKLRLRENELVERLSSQAKRSFDGGSGTFEDLSNGASRPSELARSFRSLYSDGRLQAMDALDREWKTDNSDNIKAKLLFSVMVLSFRSASDTLDRIRHCLHDIMCSSSVAVVPKHEAAVREVENTFNAYLRRTTQNYDLSNNVQEVINQVSRALYDRPGLSESCALRVYVTECVHLSWSIAVQTPPLFLEYDCQSFDSMRHERFHTSDRESGAILSYLWPSLLEKQSGRCVCKGVVITGV